ncbi:hypothetical protein TNCT_365551 [Trichonephila clavata]|uniref:Uncharacterized protein n=1 Tax=Trichonephila clavata TaxID=2740835 RepID=A0A8X6FYF6_TRICU|nr:hypothetical protein TNCT_365551 [Trichonephila clavata]
MEDRLEDLEVRIRHILNSLIAKSSVNSVHNRENEISQANSKLKLEIKLPKISLPSGKHRKTSPYLTRSQAETRRQGERAASTSRRRYRPYKLHREKDATTNGFASTRNDDSLWSNSTDVQAKDPKAWNGDSTESP